MLSIFSFSFGYYVCYGTLCGGSIIFNPTSVGRKSTQFWHWVLPVIQKKENHV